MNVFVSNKTCSIDKTTPNDDFGHAVPFTNVTGPGGDCYSAVEPIHLPMLTQTGSKTFEISVKHPVQQKGHWIEWLFVLDQFGVPIHSHQFAEPTTSNNPVSGVSHNFTLPFFS